MKTRLVETGDCGCEKCLPSGLYEWRSAMARATLAARLFYARCRVRGVRRNGRWEYVTERAS